ncbi:MAG: hypothetical protein CUN56_11205 [Phototrophicales bacterium]|nr:MAG: hypothetical protein CUN56_11205 [Phototrophicales bacterium]RMG75127.1 MAG: hypothetical protein D6711_07445 [Chloroflexota bacterium]
MFDVKRFPLVVICFLILAACGGEDEAESISNTPDIAQLTATQIVLESSRVPASVTPILDDADIQATQIVQEATRGAAQAEFIMCPAVDLTTSLSLSLNLKGVLYHRVAVFSQEQAAPCDGLDTLLYAFEVDLANLYTPQTLAIDVEHIVAALAALSLPVQGKSLLMTVPQYQSEAGVISGRVFRDVDAAIRDYQAGLRGEALLQALGGFIAD